MFIQSFTLWLREMREKSHMYGAFVDNESGKDKTDIGEFLFRRKAYCAKEALAVPKNNNRNYNVM